ncbi:hypothetical protein BGX30_007432 [Mortierella sp. GBA39]|nr:hypothetical protein BGX30_007432 [Mortierella sp. GBA39]
MIKEQRTRRFSMLTQQAIVAAEQAAETMTKRVPSNLNNNSCSSTNKSRTRCRCSILCSRNLDSSNSQNQQFPMEQIKDAFHQPLALVHLKTQDWSPGLSLAYSTSRLARPDPGRQLALQLLISAKTASPFPAPSNVVAQPPAVHLLRSVFDLLPSSLRTFISPFS